MASREEIKKEIQAMERPIGKTLREMNETERRQHLKYAFAILAEAMKPYGLVADGKGDMIAINLPTLDDLNPR